MALVAAGCGDTDGGVVADELTTSTNAPATTATVPTTSTTLPTSTSVSTVTVVPSDVDPYGTALEVMGMRWSTIEIWADGWVEIAAKVTGSPVLDRDSEIGRLFPDEVHDAIEAAGATDMLAAYEAVTSAGLVSDVLAVFAEHPEARDAVLGGPATLANTVSTTTDGAAWTTRAIDYIAPGELWTSASTGDRIALVLGERDETTLQLATTHDLDTWTVASVETASTVGVGMYDVVALADGWLLTALSYETGSVAAAWIVSDDGTATETALPGEIGCCRLEATATGVFAHAGNIGESSSAWFSGDGIDWEPREIPDGQRITGAASVRDGIVISTRDDAAAVTTQWRATPEGEDWTVTELPTEIEGEVAVVDDDHEGVAQFVAVPGWGQRGYQPPLPAVSFSIESEGIRFDFTIGESAVDEPFAVTATDLASGVVVFDRAGPIIGELPMWAHTDRAELQFFDENDELVVAVPLESAQAAYGAAVEDARAAAAVNRSPVEQAFLTSTYLLFTFDGITWSSTIVESTAGESAGWLVGSINGSRALLEDGDSGYRVIDLDDG